MSWDSSDRRARLPKDWHKRRARCWRAAGGRCQALTDDGLRCTWTGRLNGDGGQADHIDRLAGDDEANLQWLCPDHHKIKTQQEARTAATEVRALGQHPRERHPGLA